MDFEFSEEQLAFVEEVEHFLDEYDDPEVFDLTQEDMARVVDPSPRREFMARLGRMGSLEITWPVERSGKDSDGVYEHLLNEALARRRQGRRLAVGEEGGARC